MRVPKRGVYGIFNLKKPGHVYVGATGDFLQRWRQHRVELSNGYHGCSALQKDWLRHEFCFVVLEVVPKSSELAKAEVAWKRKFPLRYNTGTDNKVPGVRLSPEARRKMSASRAGHRVSKPTRKKISRANKGTKHSQKTKALLSRKAKERNARPEYRKMLSERAKKQHQVGNLGHSTWNADSEARFLENSSKAQKKLWKDPAYRKEMLKRLLGDSKEMSRRSYQRQIFKSK